MPLFRTREEAGKKLAKELLDLKKQKGEIIVLAVPRGGVPVGYEVSGALGAKFDLIIPRKIPIPRSPEAGFGAVTKDGSIVLNKPLVAELNLTDDEIKRLTKEVRQEVLRRTKVYRGDKPEPKLRNKVVILVDDGLASGFTMLAAVRAVQKKNPRKIIIAAPVCSSAAYQELKNRVDELITLHIGRPGPFAVASYYREFPEMEDREVKKYL